MDLQKRYNPRAFKGVVKLAWIFMRSRSSTLGLQEQYTSIGGPSQE
jgi:hypothetical protein